MPKELEERLKREADKKFTRNRFPDPKDREERINKYVYGTLRKTGWKPEREKDHA